ncbi:MAG: ArsA family ATPase, partial [Actinomycetia bacterium]|nr:ArsA family ATPase [Actinomycetes bacterium]
MLFEQALQRRVIFLGGKGGVGKTTVSSALALALSRAGRRVLIASTDPAHNLGHLWEQTIGDTITEVAPLLDALEIDPAATTATHLEQVRASMYGLTPEHLRPEIDRYLEMVRDSPGMHEAALLERLASVVTTGVAEYDHVILDTAPSGHTLRLMHLPEVMSAWTRGLMRGQDRSAGYSRAAAALGAPEEDTARAVRDGRIRGVLERRAALFGDLRDIIGDAARTTFVIVLTPERLPRLESTEVQRSLADAGVDVGALVVNRRTPAGWGSGFATRREQESAEIEALVADVPGIPVVELEAVGSDVTGG